MTAILIVTFALTLSVAGGLVLGDLLYRLARWLAPEASERAGEWLVKRIDG